MFKPLLVMSAALFSTSCQVTQLRNDVDRAIGDAAMEWMCHDLTINEWQRRFGQDIQSAQGWHLICSLSASAPNPNMLQQEQSNRSIEAQRF